MRQISENQIFDFEGLYARNYDKVYRFLISKGASQEVADEVCQETFIKVLKNWDHFDDAKGSEISWIITIAKNQYLDWIKKTSTSEKREIFGAQDFIESIAENQKIDEQEKWLLDLLNQSIEGLPMVEKSIIMLRFIKKYTIKETADQLGISVRTVNRKTLASLTVLRLKLQRLGVSL
ncbi:RNA polymerase sigma factor [Leptospira sp. WS92.C1]